MRHHRTGKHLGRSSAHRDAMMMNLAGSLIEHGRIKTTVTKAKLLRPYVEKLVTQARKNDVHSRRVVMRKLRMHDRDSSRRSGGTDVVSKLFNDVAPRFVGRPGGYTRIIKIGTRPGDATEMAFIEWVDYEPQAKAHTHQGHSHAHTHDHEPAATASA